MTKFIKFIILFFISNIYILSAHALTNFTTTTTLTNVMNMGFFTDSWVIQKTAELKEIALSNVNQTDKQYYIITLNFNNVDGISSPPSVQFNIFYFSINDLTTLNFATITYYDRGGINFTYILNSSNPPTNSAEGLFNLQNQYIRYWNDGTSTTLSEITNYRGLGLQGFYSTDNKLYKNPIVSSNLPKTNIDAIRAYTFDNWGDSVSIDGGTVFDSSTGFKWAYNDVFSFVESGGGGGEEEIIPPPPTPTDNFVDNVDNFLDYQTEQLDTFKTLLNDVYIAIPEILRLFLVMVYSGVWVSILIRSLRN